MTQANQLRYAVALWIGYGICGCATADTTPESPQPPAADAADSSSDAPVSDTSGFDQTVLPCSKGQIMCDGTIAKTCDSTGGWYNPVDCAKDGKPCIDGYGCTQCIPGAGSCAGGIAQVCRADGTGYATFECDPVQGMDCQPEGCKGACAWASLGPSYIGCDYFPTVTLNPVWPMFNFAVVVGNTSDKQASITITKGSETLVNKTLEPGALTTIKLPWVDDLKGPAQDENTIVKNDPGGTRVVKAGAYRLRSNQPVTVYQFSALEYTFDPAPADCPPAGADPQYVKCDAYTNDASLLLPAHTLTGSYATLSWPSLFKAAGFIAITATQDGTKVKLVDPVGSDSFAPGGGIDGMGKGEVTLDAGDVLEVLARHDQGSGTWGPDISGTRVQADKPVQVISGHACALVPSPSTAACDHLEQSMFPIETIGKDYYVTVPSSPSGLQPQVVRIMAIEPNTSLMFDPQLHDPTSLSPGDGPLQLEDIKQDLHIIASGPVLVAQYMEGGSLMSDGKGDPSESLAIPTPQFRKDYLFLAPATYDQSYVNVIAPPGTAITLDGQPLAPSDFAPIGTGGTMSVARKLLAPTEVHKIESAQKFGIVVYGFGDYTTYMYPGGLDLERITAAPPPK
ncbi:MAG: IgGFc-binding protein [Deltaproteobacteria bacterium]|nr:IgGFc-binding protein [Deltaproteobacteria bacterium]